MNYDVFISYHQSIDGEAAKVICHALEQSGIKCWMAPRDIPLGSDYYDEIYKAMDYCEVVLVLFSEASSRSQWIMHEVNCVFEEQKKIIMFALDQTPIRGQYRVMLNKALWIDAFPDYRSKINELVLSVSHSIGKEVPLVKTGVKSSMKRKYKKFFIISIVLLIIGVVVLLYLLFVKK